MKKSLLSFVLGCLFSAFPAFAFVGTPAPFNGTLAKPAVERAPMKAATANGFDILFSGALNGFYAFSNVDNTTYRCFTYITPDVATKLAGNKLTEVTFATALIESESLPGSVFVSEAIDQAPVSSTAATITNCYIIGSDPNNPTVTVQTVALESPYEIKEDTGFFFGYTVEGITINGEGDYPVGIGASDANPFSGYCEVSTASGEVIFFDSMAASADANLYLMGTTVGDKKSLDNILSVNSITLGNFTLPVTNKFSGNKAKVKVTNLGSNRITKINYTLSVTGGSEITKDKTVSISSTRGTTLSLDLPDYVEGRGEVKFVVNSINGTPVSNTYGTADYIALAESPYQRKFVVEEGTGTWCGWCPRGIVGFETMEAKYPDTFVGIACHYGDEMQVASYGPIYDLYPGFPSALINRDLGFMIDPSAENLESNKTVWDSQLAIAKVKVEAEKPADGKMHVAAHTEFCIDDADADYAIAFVILENDVLGIQTNYYAGGGRGACGGWEKMEDKQPWFYKHVARDIFNFYGIQGSVPANVVAGKEYSFEYDLSIAHVEDPSKTAVVALLLDGATGVILNADKIEADNYGLVGINDVIGDNFEAPVEYFNIQGQPMRGDALPSGIYITRQGSKVSKVVIR